MRVRIPCEEEVDGTDMPRAFESDDFMTFFVDVDLWLCTGCLFPILDHDEEESTDGEG